MSVRDLPPPAGHLDLDPGGGLETVTTLPHRGPVRRITGSNRTAGKRDASADRWRPVRRGKMNMRRQDALAAAEDRRRSTEGPDQALQRTPIPPLLCSRGSVVLWPSCWSKPLPFRPPLRSADGRAEPLWQPTEQFVLLFTDPRSWPSGRSGAAGTSSSSQPDSGLGDRVGISHGCGPVTDQSTVRSITQKVQIGAD